MKKQSAILLILALMTGMVFSVACKKKDEAGPAPTVNTDNYDMGTDATATIDVLANDSYTGTANLTANVGSDYGTVSITSDKKVLYTPKTNYYGTVTISYTVSDNNGSSTGNLIIKRGTDAQINTYTLIKSFVSSNFLWLYSVDGDSSRIYSSTYAAEQIFYGNFHLDYLGVSSAGGVIIPNLGDYTYSILSNGSLFTHANYDNSSVILTDFEAFTDPHAKKRDGSGTMSVSGYSFYYGTKKLIYTTQVQ